MLLSNPFRPDPRVLREARWLIGSGIAVNLIAWDREEGRSGRALEDDVAVTRVGPECPFRAPGKVLMRLPRFWARTLFASKGMKFDVVHSHDLDTLPLGIVISKVRGVPIIYDSHEMYASMIRSEVGVVSRLVRLLEIVLSRRADRVITVNENLAGLFSVRRKDPARIVTNSPDTSVLKDANATEIRRKYNLKGFVVSYLGSLEPGRFVEEMMTSFDPNGDMSLIIGGTGTLERVVEKKALENPAIRFVRSVHTDEALRLTLASDLVVAMMDPQNENYRKGTTTKVLDAMACGRSVVTAEGLDIARMVTEAGCGFVIAYDQKAFYETLAKAKKSQRLLAEMGQKGRQYYEKHWPWEKSRNELVTVYESLVGPIHRGP